MAPRCLRGSAATRRPRGRRFSAPMSTFSGCSILPRSIASTSDLMSHVIHYGSSVFEGIRCYAPPSGPAIFRANEHIQRLLDSAKVYRIDVRSDVACDPLWLLGV